jgi:hypothetical protein
MIKTFIFLVTFLLNSTFAVASPADCGQFIDEIKDANYKLYFIETDQFRGLYDGWKVEFDKYVEENIDLLNCQAGDYTPLTDMLSNHPLPLTFSAAYLINKGADVNAFGKHWAGKSPLLEALMAYDSLYVTAHDSYLLKNDSFTGTTKSRLKEIVSLLVRKGADIEFSSKYDVTVNEYAKKCNLTELLQNN